MPARCYYQDVHHGEELDRGVDWHETAELSSSGVETMAAVGLVL